MTAPRTSSRLPIVVGLDGSPESLTALAWAGRQAELTGAPLHTVTAVRPHELGLHRGDDVDGLAPTARTMLGDAIAETLGEERAAAVTVHLSADAAARALVQHSQGAQLVVVGPHSYGGLPGVLLGSVPQRVITYAHCPVAVARPEPPDGEPRIVVGLDGSGCSRAALRWAIRQAGLADARVDALVAWGSLPLEGLRLHGSADAALERGAAELLDAELDALPATGRGIVTGRIVKAQPARALIEAAGTARLLVIGSRGRSAGFGHLIGSTGLKCLKHAPGPVVAIHCPPTDRPAP